MASSNGRKLTRITSGERSEAQATVSCLDKLITHYQSEIDFHKAYWYAAEILDEMDKLTRQAIVVLILESVKASFDDLLKLPTAS